MQLPVNTVVELENRVYLIRSGINSIKNAKLLASVHNDFALITTENVLDKKYELL